MCDRKCVEKEKGIVCREIESAYKDRGSVCRDRDRECIER